jgi:hypothetical protein
VEVVLFIGNRARAASVCVLKKSPQFRAPEGGRNRIMILWPGTPTAYIVEFRIANGESLAISVPGGETRVLKHFQERMPYGLFVPDVT